MVRFNMRSACLLALFMPASLSLLTGRPVAAQVIPAPSLLNFQGRLTKPDGTPIADGTYALRFSLWDALTGGSEKWNQTFASVAVRNGVFGVLLNADTPGLFNSNLWMEIKVGGDVPLSPRQPLVSVAYALKANTVPDGSITTAKLASDAKTAGGDLTGTYPNPQLATLKSSLAKVSGNVLQVSNTGNVGISVADPGLNRVQINPTFHLSNGYGLTVSNARFGANVQYNGQGGLGLVVDKTDGANGSLPFLVRRNVGTAPVNLFSVSDTGNVGIGTTNPQSALDVRGNINMGTANLPLGLTHEVGGDTPLLNLDVNFRQVSRNTRFQGAAIRIDTRSGLPLFSFLRRPAGSATDFTLLTIDESGMLSTSRVSASNAYFNSLSTGYMEVEGYFNARSLIDARAGLNAYASGSGYAVHAIGTLKVDGNGFANFWYLNSDSRFKKQVQPMTQALDTILQLNGVTYEWIDPKNGTGRQVGFIAQDVEKILPQIVGTRPDGYKGVSYQSVVPVLVEAVKTLKSQLDDKQKQIESLQSLRAENAEMKQRLDALTAAMERLMVAQERSK